MFLGSYMGAFRDDRGASVGFYDDGVVLLLRLCAVTGVGRMLRRELEKNHNEETVQRSWVKH